MTREPHAAAFKRLCRCALFSVALGTAVASSAFAGSILWTLNDISFPDGGTASGSFDYNADTGQFSSIDIVTTAGSQFGGATYTLLDPNGFFLSNTQLDAVSSNGNLTGSPILGLLTKEPMTDQGGVLPLLIAGEGVCNDPGCRETATLDRSEFGNGSISSSAPVLLPELCPTDAISGDCFFGFNTAPPAPPPGYYWTPNLPVYDFSGSNSGDWFDPSIASGYAYQMTGVGLFTSIVDFPTGFSQPFDVTAPGCTIPMTFLPGQSLNFVTLCGQGVSEFEITGISPTFDPTDSGAFPIELAFNTSTASFVATPLLATPDPATITLMGIGLIGLCGLRLRRQ